MNVVMTITLLAGLFQFGGCADDKATDANSNATNGNTGTSTVTGTKDIVGPAKTKSECNSSDLSWIAVVRGGESPATCGAPTSAWGCCKEDVIARFPTLAKSLDEKIQQKLDEDYKLYNCSTAADRDHKLHFARFPGDGRTEYYEIEIEAFAYTPQEGIATNCPKYPKVDFPGEVASNSQVGSNSGTDSAAFQSVNEIISAGCGTSTCHGSGSAYVLVDDSSALESGRDAILDRIQRAEGAPGRMPPQASPDLSTEDRDALISYLQSL